jgi:hypothetical protein
MEFHDLLLLSFGTFLGVAILCIFIVGKERDP